jgi:hypothetical protein
VAFVNLERHLSVLWRFRGLVLVGALFGFALAALATFKISVAGGMPNVERRGTQVWTSESDTFVTQPGFPWGRVTLPPQAPAPATGTEQSAEPTPDPDALEFADPSRFSNLAMLYSVIAYSDRVRARLPERPSADQVKATAFDATGNGTTFLPIVKIETQAESARKAQLLNLHAIEALKDLLTEEQRRNEIPANQRVRLNVLNAPTAPTLVSGPSMTPAFLAIVLSLLGAVALAHVLESLRPRHAGAAAASSEPGTLAAVGSLPLDPAAPETSEAPAAEGSARRAR